MKMLTGLLEEMDSNQINRQYARKRKFATAQCAEYYGGSTAGGVSLVRKIYVRLSMPLVHYKFEHTTNCHKYSPLIFSITTNTHIIIIIINY